MATIASSTPLQAAKQERHQIANQHNLLSEKIARALKHSGYTFEDENKVAKLAIENTVEFQLLLSHEALRAELDRALLEAVQNKSPEFQLNSNEPVLLLIVSTAIQIDARRVKDELIDYLRSRNIKPVRVYVQLSNDMSKAVLLNVVNTEIGGPSMVQLLDAAFHTNWKSELVLKEAWNGYDLLWRDEAWPSSGPERVVSERHSATDELRVSQESSDVEPVGHDEIDNQDDSQDETDLALVAVDVEESATNLAQHPAYVELQARELQRRHIAHPSWDRSADDSRGLLDVIESQSAGMGIIEARPDSDDGFEIIEQTT